MTSLYQGFAQVAFSEVGIQDFTSFALSLKTITLVDLTPGTYEVTLLGDEPEVATDSYVRILLPDGSEHSGRVTGVCGSTIAFLGNFTG
ncbi:hypothetical protein SFA35_13045 [Pseudomonas sp. HR96]|uniref:hypothetical protein n=1 Tax=Pseudomonas sp. HR96 TaxID=1027966 RepID=UPI002A75530F|nr:hypothetical protein [Pseudomonas sp. HR96]WPO97597.1 hypothetical protein SFA35_13045 [Pseudomonas sp. HR96]